MTHFLRVSVTALLLATAGHLFAQQLDNSVQNQGYVSVALPKTPESAGFEQFGKFPVNEVTGTPGISIPIYTLKGRYLEVPIELSYHPTGIKVNQESSWVGLGFDLIAGGRITVETKGCADFSSATRGFYSPTGLAAGLTKLFNRLGNSSSQSILTYASICGSTPGGCDVNVADDDQTVWAMAQFGAGQPDIFHANFMGKSLTFFIDKITGNVTDLGEQSQFRVYPTIDAYNNITSWTIVDNEGVTYTFGMTETTTLVMPPNAAIPANSTSAWLLTSMSHPNGDNITFTYANYGSTYPAFTWSSSRFAVPPNGGVTESNEVYQNLVTESPYYLTRIESADIAVDLFLGNRTDLYGPGSRRLDSLRVSDKQTGTVWKRATFYYGYFNSGTDACHSHINVLNLSAGQLACSNLRLRLDSLSINNRAYQPPYRFYYAGTPPDKYSFSQDHWGYYNGAAMTGCAPKYMLPNTGHATGAETGAAAGNPGMDAYGANRESNANMIVGTMDSIAYPTGGSTFFLLEPHQFSMLGAAGTITGVPNTIMGAGLRVKAIRDYSMGRLTGSIEYDYQYGYSSGKMQYHTIYNKVPDHGSCDLYVVPYDMMNVFGFVNDAPMVVAYPVVTVTQRNPSGRTNGSVLKVFMVKPGLSPIVKNAHYPTNVYQNFIIDWESGFPPTPAGNLDGKLLNEQYFDSSENLVKRVDYYYRMANFSQKFYDVRTVDMTVHCTQGYLDYLPFSGARPYLIYVSPNKTYTSVLDSTLETYYTGSNKITKKNSYTYNTIFQRKSMTEVNSDGTQTVTNYLYPYDYMEMSGPAVYQYMVGAHIYSPVVSTSVTRNGVPVSYAINNYALTGGLYLPQNTQVQVAGNPLETRQLYNAYDAYGHPLELQKPGGVKEDYLWGYNQRFVVAKVVGSNYTTVGGIVNATILNNPSDDNALRTETNKLRTGLTNALVTTYTYNLVGELTSETDPRGVTTYYEYDVFGRLKWIKDKDGNILKTMQYKYQTSPLLY